MTAAAISGDGEFKPPDVSEAIARWEEWLAHDPMDPVHREPSFAERVARFQEQVQAMEEVA